MKRLWLILLLYAPAFSWPAFSQQTWWKTYGRAGNEIGYCVRQTQDGGYIITGTATNPSPGYSDLWLVKTDSLGDTLWTRTFGGGTMTWATLSNRLRTAAIS